MRSWMRELSVSSSARSSTLTGSARNPGSHDDAARIVRREPIETERAGAVADGGQARCGRPHDDDVGRRDRPAVRIDDGAAKWRPAQCRAGHGQGEQERGQETEQAEKTGGSRIVVHRLSSRRVHAPAPASRNHPGGRATHWGKGRPGRSGFLTCGSTHSAHAFPCLRSRHSGGVPSRNPPGARSPLTVAAPCGLRTHFAWSPGGRRLSSQSNTPPPKSDRAAIGLHRPHRDRVGFRLPATPSRQLRFDQITCLRSRSE